MSMTPPLRKLALTAHVSASVGWLGALAVFLAHALASLLRRASASFDGEGKETRLARRKRNWIANIKYLAARSPQ